MSDDDDWFDAATGRPSASSADPGAALEGRLLRIALQERARRTADLPFESRKQSILQAASRIDPEQGGAGCRGCARRRRSVAAWLARPWAWGGALAGTTALALVVLSWPGPSTVEPVEPVLRTPAEASIPRLSAEQPRQRRDALAERLLADGAVVRRYERLGRFGLDADLTRPPSPSLLAELAALGLPAPSAGVVRVEFEQAAR